MVIASQKTSVSKNGSYLSVGVEKSNCEQLWCDHGLVWKKVILLPVVKGELTSAWKEPPAKHLLHIWKVHKRQPRVGGGGSKGGWVKVKDTDRSGGYLNSTHLATIVCSCTYRYQRKYDVRKIEMKKSKTIIYKSQENKKGDTRRKNNQRLENIRKNWKQANSAKQ